MMRSVLLVAALFLSAPALAQGNYYNPSSGKEGAPAPPAAKNLYVVTSLQKCYDSLDRADALEIQRNYVKPYQECLRRLDEKERKEKTLKTGEKKPETAPPAAKTK